MFRFDINLTDQDYYKFNLFHGFESKYLKRIVLGLQIAIAVLYLWVCVSTVIRNGIKPSTFVGLIPSVILGVLFIALVRPFYKLVVKMFIKSKKNLYSPVSTMEFSEEYAVETTPNSEMKYKYSALDTAYFVREEVVYIYINIQQAFLIPRASFESQEQWDGFLEFIKTKMDDVVVVE